jgi:predicted ester cyclase
MGAVAAAWEAGEARADGHADLASLYCRFIDSVVNRRGLDHLDQFLARDVVEHAPDPSVGLAASRRRLAHWLAAFPDLHLVIEDLVVEGDRLMARLRATGTRGAPRGGGPGGRRLSLPVFEAWAVRDGRCVERWLHLDRGACGWPPLVPGRNGAAVPDEPD